MYDIKFYEMPLNSQTEIDLNTKLRWDNIYNWVYKKLLLGCTQRLPKMWSCNTKINMSLDFFCSVSILSKS